jgi:nitrogen regulatory protein PII-like uncharacterized protein
MDEFIQSFQQFSVTNDKEKFEESLEDVICKLNELNDLDAEWKTLRSNYSKLKYLHELVEKYYIPDSQTFLRCLEKFLKKLDSVTEYYLDEIDWYDGNGLHLKIKIQFEKSLQTNDCIEKLKYLMKGYSMLVGVVETIRNETCIENINNEFKEEFNFKRRKMN